MVRATLKRRLGISLVLPVAVCGAAACAASSGSHSSGPGATTVETVATAPSDRAADQMILDQLRAAGADLAKPRNVRHHIYTHDQQSARSLAAQLSGRYKTSVDRATDGSGDWRVTAEKAMVVNMTTIAPEEAVLSRAAKAVGGTYDGWEAAATP